MNFFYFILGLLLWVSIWGYITYYYLKYKAYGKEQWYDFIMYIPAFLFLNSIIGICRFMDYYVSRPKFKRGRT